MVLTIAHRTNPESSRRTAELPTAEAANLASSYFSHEPLILLAATGILLARLVRRRAADLVNTETSFFPNAPLPLSRSARVFLERCVWPRSLTHTEREAAFHALVEREYSTGALVCQRNEVAGSWIGVVEGFLRVQDATEDGRPIMYTGVATGGWIGEGSLLKVEPRKYEIVATRPTLTVQMPRSTFASLVDHSMPFNHFLLAHLNERLGQFIAMVKYERLLEPTSRVARGIASLFHPLLYPNTEPTLRISQEEIAWLVGMSRQRVNLAIHQLAEEGIIQAGYGSLTVLDLKRLSRYGSEG